jgi:hypothetical protein
MKLYTLARAPLALAALSLSLLTLWGCPNPNPPQPLFVAGDTVAYWKFDGTPLDFSHRGHTAVPQGTIHYTSDIYGRRGMGLYLDGHGYLTVPDSSDLHITKKSSYTIVTWVRTLDSSKVPIITWNSASGHAKLEFTLSGGKPNVVISAVPQTLELKGSVAVNDGLWHMLTVSVATPHTVDIYVDSSLVANSATGSLMPTDSAIGRLYIGATSDTLTLAKAAQFDEFIILNKSVDLVQVKSLMSDGGIPTGPPVGICNPTTGKLFSVATDGYHGTWQGNWNWSNPTNGDSLHAIDYSDLTHALDVGYRHIEHLEDNSGQLAWANIDISSLPPDFNLMDVKILSPKMAIAVGGTFDPNTHLVLLLTTPTANDWTAATIAQAAPTTATAMFEAIAIAPDSSVWIAGKNGQIYRTPSPLFGSPSWTKIAVPDTTKWFRGIDFKPGVLPTQGLVVTDDGFGYDITNGVVTYAMSTGGRSFWTARCSGTSKYAGATGTHPNPGASATAVSAPYDHNDLGLYIDWVGQTGTTTMPVNSWFSSCRALDLGHVYFGETRNRRAIVTP